MTFQTFNVGRILCFFLLVFPCLGLNIDGVLLMSFKLSVSSDPLGVFSNWNAGDDTPCSWRGVTCEALRVTGLALPDSQILGSVVSSLGMIQFLRNLDLSNNSINGSIPSALFAASQLQSLDFSNNQISGQLPETVGRLRSLRSLNLSGNALAGVVPESLTGIQNLTAVNLKDNYLSGSLHGGFDAVQELDLSSNLINGSLPPNFGGTNLRYLNVSFNRFSGEIPPEFSSRIPPNATLDLSFNNFSGEIPDSSVFLNQDVKAFAGNPGLCGVPLENLCHAPSEPTSPPAIAAIPKTIHSNPAADSPDSGSSPASSRTRLKTGSIIAIVVGDVAAVAILALIFIYAYRAKRRKAIEGTIKKEAESAKDFDWASSSASPTEYNWLSSESPKGQQPQLQAEQKTGELVTLDGEKELELETLLKASAYILGASGSSILYKAVLEDGTTLAVRRIGESGFERFREFETQVRVIAKLIHPNLVRIRGFYWGADEKLVIYDFVPNGSLANARYRKPGCSPCHLPWGVRLRIARGVARGLSYIHEKKHVHGNLKPSNILLGGDMEPKIGDFGLERLITGESSHKAYGSARNLGSKRSTTSRESLQDFASGPTPSPSPSALGISPYHAPESLRSLKPNPKWDVFSFGVVLLEFLTGKVIVSDEMCPGPMAGAVKLGDEEKSRVLKMADVTIRADMEGKEEAFYTLVRLGYNCISPVPHKRPTMKEVIQALDNFPTTTSPSYYYAI
nr:probable LRR receptor-like serine/threonine-protein kinase At4g37250 [Ipomoea batatas]